LKKASQNFGIERELVKYQVKIEGEEFKVGIKEKDGELKVDLEGKEILANLSELKKNKIYSLLVNDRTYDLEIRRKNGEFEINYGGEKYSGEILDERLAKLKPPTEKEGLKQKELKAPMPGLIVKIEVEEGQIIKSGEGVVIMEAMKMENEIKSLYDGKVKKIMVSEKETVDKDQVLLILE